MTITFRGGRLPNNPTKRRLKLGHYLTGPVLPSAPRAVNWDAKVSAFGMLQNQNWGDCAEAGDFHALQILTANAGTELVPTDTDALRAYSEITGFNPQAGPPGENPTDQGTIMQDSLDFWRKTGLSVGGTRHKIVAFAEVDHRDPAVMEQAIALFGNLLLGIDFPQAAMDQTDRGEPWDYVPGAGVKGGHAICSARYDAASRAPWTIITWGAEQKVTQAFMDHYLEEAWTVVAPEWVAANGSTPSGLDLAAFGADFAVLTGDDNPFPDVTPPGPRPRPGGLDEAVQALTASPDVRGWLAAPHAGKTRRVARLVQAVVDAS